MNTKSPTAERADKYMDLLGKSVMANRKLRGKGVIRDDEVMALTDILRDWKAFRSSGDGNLKTEKEIVDRAHAMEIRFRDRGLKFINEDDGHEALALKLGMVSGNRFGIDIRGAGTPFMGLVGAAKHKKAAPKAAPAANDEDLPVIRIEAPMYPREKILLDRVLVAAAKEPDKEAAARILSEDNWVALRILQLRQKGGHWEWAPPPGALSPIETNRLLEYVDLYTPKKGAPFAPPGVKLPDEKPTPPAPARPSPAPTPAPAAVTQKPATAPFVKAAETPPRAPAPKRPATPAPAPVETPMARAPYGPPAPTPARAPVRSPAPTAPGPFSAPAMAQAPYGPPAPAPAPTRAPAPAAPGPFSAPAMAQAPYGPPAPAVSRPSPPPPAPAPPAPPPIPAGLPKGDPLGIFETGPPSPPGQPTPGATRPQTGVPGGTPTGPAKGSDSIFPGAPGGKKDGMPGGLPGSHGGSPFGGPGWGPKLPWWAWLAAGVVAYKVVID